MTAEDEVVERLMRDAAVVVDEMLIRDGVAAIPAIIGQACLWAVEHGAADFVRDTLSRAIMAVDEISRDRMGKIQ